MWDPGEYQEGKNSGEYQKWDAKNKALDELN